MTTNTPRTEPQPSTWFRKIVAGGFHIAMLTSLVLAPPAVFAADPQPAKKDSKPRFTIFARDRAYLEHRPKGCTVLTIQRRGWEGNEFGLWLPEAINIDGANVWSNWQTDPHQEFRQDAGGRWSWSAKFEGVEFQSTLEPDAEQDCLWCIHRFTNKGERAVKNLEAHSCFHLVNAPQFISIRGERIWANLDGKWTTTDQAPRAEAPVPDRVGFLRQGQRSERTVMPSGFIAIMPQAAHHPLFIAEAFEGKASVGVAGRDFIFLANNNDCILRCLHSTPKPIPQLEPGETRTLDFVIVLCDGDHKVALETFEHAVSARWGRTHNLEPKE